ncbi:class I SAM-dependent methyltransferase, partial [Vibrio sp. 10N.222.46.A1]
MPNPTKPQMKPLIRKSHTYDQKASSDLGSA